METKNFENKMENLTTPQIRSESTKRILKITLLNSRKSAGIGLLLIALPFVFMLGNVLKYNLGIDIGFINLFVQWIGSFDTIPFVNWIVRILLLGGPMIAILINLMAITHFYTDKKANEFIITLKLRWLNILIILFCSLIMFLFFSYLIVENLNHP